MQQQRTPASSLCDGHTSHPCCCQGSMHNTAVPSRGQAVQWLATKANDSVNMTKTPVLAAEATQAATTAQLAVLVQPKTVCTVPGT